MTFGPAFFCLRFTVLSYLALEDLRGLLWLLKLYLDFTALNHLAVAPCQKVMAGLQAADQREDGVRDRRRQQVLWVSR